MPKAATYAVIWSSERELYLPHLPASLIPRERLLTRLDAGLEGNLTLLSAPTGFGIVQ